MIVTKQKLINTTLTTLLIVSAGAWAASDTATINVTATVVNNTCTPTWSATGYNVPMNRVSAKDIKDGAGTANKRFTLRLSDCGDGGEKVSVTAKGSSDANNQALFKNLEDGDKAATGVGVSLWAGEAQNTQLQPGGGQAAEYTITNGEANMELLAKVETTGGEGSIIKAGALKSVINLEVAYQ